MVRVMLTAQAYNDLLGLPALEMEPVKRALNRLADNPGQGLKLYGQEDLFLFQTASDTRIVYRLTAGEIQVISIQPGHQPVGYPTGRLNLAAVVLAAGHSGYSGLLPLTGLIDCFLNAGVDEMVVVVGDRSEHIRHDLQHRNVTLVTAAYRDEGLGKSLRCGLKMLSPRARAVLLSLGNRPFITSEIVLSVIRAYKTSRAPLVVPTYSQMRGHPVLFDSTLVPELLRAHGDHGGRNVIQRHNHELAQIDIGNPAILERIWAN